MWLHILNNTLIPTMYVVVSEGGNFSSRYFSTRVKSQGLGRGQINVQKSQKCQLSQRGHRAHKIIHIDKKNVKCTGIRWYLCPKQLDTKIKIWNMEIYWSNAPSRNIYACCWRNIDPAWYQLVIELASSNVRFSTVSPF